MKQVFTFLAAVLLTATAWAQSPEKMSYQAVIRNSNEALVTNTTVGMQISILQGSENGTAVYVETQNPTTNANGLVNIEIGTGTVESGDFTTIDWANGTYFIKTETDPAGGTNYTITGTSQLLSVPYALHAKTAETVTGGITETDPTFTSSEAANINATDITNLGNLSGVNTGDQDLSTLATKTALGDSTAQVRSEIPDVSGIATNTQAIQDTAAQIRADIPVVPNGTQAGDMQYWNGSEWITVAAGNEGQMLRFVGGVPAWTTVVGVTIVGSTDVYNPTTGEIWMDRNLGASQVATSSTDAASYGDLYQWGRAADGHESRTSAIASTNASSAVPNDGNAWDGLFITEGSSPYDWLTSQDDNLWQGVSGTNNPCPSGYRLPTEAELNAERLSWSSNNSAGAFGSPLKLPVAGSRGSSNGSLYGVGSYGYYWSSTVAGSRSRALYFGSGTASVYSLYRAYGFSVRCLKD